MTDTVEALRAFGDRLAACPEDTPDAAFAGIEMTHGEVRAVRAAIVNALASTPTPQAPVATLSEVERLREAAQHLLDVGEFCRTDDTESALRQLRAALSPKAQAQAPVATLSEVERWNAAWHRFFYPHRTDFRGEKVELKGEVLLALADSLRECMQRFGIFNEGYPREAAPALSPKAQDRGPIQGEVERARAFLKVQNPGLVEPAPWLLESTIRALASLAASPSNEERLREALDWFGAQRDLSLDFRAPIYGDDDDQTEEWQVTMVSGPINDREWGVVGRGATPLAAILDARAALEGEALQASPAGTAAAEPHPER